MLSDAIRRTAGFAVIVWLSAVTSRPAAAAEPTRSVDPVSIEEEAYLFTPQGFEKPGEAKTLTADDAARVKILVRNFDTNQPTFCRINVVGPDGNFYQPAENYLTPFALTGEWPKTGKGNRQGKAPYRYYGRFFYSWGEAEVKVPAGPVRVEVWKGLEYRPATANVTVEAGKTTNVELALGRPLKMPEAGYYSGDPHIHITRADDRDENLILDLMEAEGIRYGSILAYNEPAGPYTGIMKSLDMPQYRGLGFQSIRSRGEFHILSGQEYRSSTYGHLNLFGRDNLALEGQKLNADNGPPYGTVGRDTKQKGGYAFYAHGGYAQSIYADFAQGDVDGVELLQFGIYRGIGLEDWYGILNIGYRFPATGACDYPACRKLGDAMTYVYSKTKPTFAEWLKGAADGRSFVTTGPMVLLEVDGHKPGETIEQAGNDKHSRTAKLLVMSEVAPVTNLQLIVNGKVSDVSLGNLNKPFERGGTAFETEVRLEVSEPTWIAARAFSKSPAGNADAEAHTNPVYVYVDGRKPYDRDSLDRIVEKIDGQIKVHKARDFPQKAEVVAYFEHSRDILMAIREANGIPPGKNPADIAKQDLPVLKDPGARTHTEEELKAFLKPLPPKTPAEALKSFETINGFEMQLVSHEPDVYSPISAAFDEDGHLYVCEMRDYPYYPKPGDKPIGSLRLLRDTDGDGVFDKSSVFANELLWAGGVVPWKGGVFVAAPPDIWYMKDTDGDDVADVRRKVFTGFGVENQQAMLNNLKFGLDHKIYGATAGNGGTVRPGDKPDAPGVSVEGNDFRFDPESETFEPITGTVQFGNSFDDWDNRFVCSQGNPLEHVVLPRHYLARNPYLPVPKAIHDIAGGRVPIYRISPTERWRQIRSSRRIAHHERDAESTGASHHVVDAAAGVTIYRGGAYPKEFYGNVFVGDAQNDLVHRRILTPTGVTFDSHRADEKTEFVRSSDNWFRPVNFVNAPDGTLYVLDMSREILESIHIPFDVLKFLDLKSGRNSGRIYRMAPAGFKSPPPPKLSNASNDELLAALESPHGWWRETAHRLVFERQDKTLVEPLRRMLHDSKRPESRLHALWSLEGLGALEDGDLVTAFHDSQSQIREHAMRLSESRLDKSPKLFELTLAQAGDADDRIRLQAAFSLGETRDPRAVDALAVIARRDAGNEWIRTAVLSSCAESADRLFAQIAADSAFLKSDKTPLLLEQLAMVVGSRNRAVEINRLLQTLATTTEMQSRRDLQQNLVRALGEGLHNAGAHFSATNVNSPESAALVASLLQSSQETAANAGTEIPSRVAAIRLLGTMEQSRVEETLSNLLSTREPLEVQLAAVNALAGFDDSRMAGLLLANWDQAVPDVRLPTIRALLSREPWTIGLLQEIVGTRISAAEVDSLQRNQLREHRNTNIRDLAARAFANDTSSPRGDVINSYQKVLELKGDVARGERIFEQNCTVCHRIGTKGHAIGPELASTASAEPQALLAHILDPNKYVLPNFVQYVVVDTNGLTHTGMIASQTATSITLKREKNETETILRTNIDELKATGKSLMPEGFEKKIAPPEMADLIAFLAASRQAQPDEERPLDIGTEPGLVEPD